MNTSRTILNNLPFPCDILSPGSAVLDISSTKRFARTGVLTQVLLVRRIRDHLEETAMSPSSEEEEFEALNLLSRLLTEDDAPSEIITYNGNAFDLNFLEKKYSLYSLPNPFEGKTARDLFTEYRICARIFALPSRKLDDLCDFLDIPLSLDDAVKCCGILMLDPLKDLFEGKWTLEDASRDETHLYYSLRTERPLFRRVSIHDQTYHLFFEGDLARLAVVIQRGRIRRYYTDYKDYWYLPNEGYAIHRDMAAFVEKSHKEKAVRENCFSLVAVSDSLTSDREIIRNYIDSVIRYLRSR